MGITFPLAGQNSAKCQPWIASAANQVRDFVTALQKVRTLPISHARLPHTQASAGHVGQGSAVLLLVQEGDQQQGTDEVLGALVLLQQDQGELHPRLKRELQTLVCAALTVRKGLSAKDAEHFLQVICLGPQAQALLESPATRDRLAMLWRAAPHVGGTLDDYLQNCLAYLQGKLLQASGDLALLEGGVPLGKIRQLQCEQFGPYPSHGVVSDRQAELEALLRQAHSQALSGEWGQSMQRLNQSLHRHEWLVQVPAQVLQQVLRHGLRQHLPSTALFTQVKQLLEQGFDKGALQRDWQAVWSQLRDGRSVSEVLGGLNTALERGVLTPVAVLYGVIGLASAPLVWGPLGLILAAVVQAGEEGLSGAMRQWVGEAESEAARSLQEVARLSSNCQALKQVAAPVLEPLGRWVHSLRAVASDTARLEIAAIDLLQQHLSLELPEDCGSNATAWRESMLQSRFVRTLQQEQTELRALPKLHPAQQQRLEQLERATARYEAHLDTPRPVHVWLAALYEERERWHEQLDLVNQPLQPELLEGDSGRGRLDPKTKAALLEQAKRARGMVGAAQAPAEGDSVAGALFAQERSMATASSGAGRSTGVASLIKPAVDGLRVMLGGLVHVYNSLRAISPTAAAPRPEVCLSGTRRMPTGECRAPYSVKSKHLRTLQRVPPNYRAAAPVPPPRRDTTAVTPLAVQTAAQAIATTELTPALVPHTGSTPSGWDARPPLDALRDMTLLDRILIATASAHQISLQSPEAESTPMPFQAKQARAVQSIIAHLLGKQVTMDSQVQVATPIATGEELEQLFASTAARQLVADVLKIPLVQVSVVMTRTCFARVAWIGHVPGWNHTTTAAPTPLIAWTQLLQQAAHTQLLNEHSGHVLLDMLRRAEGLSPQAHPFDILTARLTDHLDVSQLQLLSDNELSQWAQAGVPAVIVITPDVSQVQADDEPTYPNFGVMPSAAALREMLQRMAGAALDPSDAWLHLAVARAQQAPGNQIFSLAMELADNVTSLTAPLALALAAWLMPPSDAASPRLIARTLWQQLPDLQHSPLSSHPFAKISMSKFGALGLSSQSLWYALAGTVQFTEAARPLLKRLGWLGGNPGEQASPAQTQALMGHAMVEMLLASGTPTSDLGALLYNMQTRAEPYCDMRDRIGQHIRQQFSHEPQWLADLFEYLFLRELAPELLIKDIPAHLTPRSLLSVSFLQGVSILEDLQSEASQGRSFAELVALPARLIHHPGLQEAWAVGYLQGALPYAIAHGAITLRPLQQINLDQVKQALEFAKNEHQRHAAALQTLLTALPERRAIAQDALRQAGVGESYWSKPPLGTQTQRYLRSNGLSKAAGYAWNRELAEGNAVGTASLLELVMMGQYNFGEPVPARFERAFRQYRDSMELAMTNLMIRLLQELPRAERELLSSSTCEVSRLQFQGETADAPYGLFLRCQPGDHADDFTKHRAATETYFEVFPLNGCIRRMQQHFDYHRRFERSPQGFGAMMHGAQSGHIQRRQNARDRISPRERFAVQAYMNASLTDAVHSPQALATLVPAGSLSAPQPGEGPAVRLAGLAALMAQHLLAPQLDASQAQGSGETPWEATWKGERAVLHSIKRLLIPFYACTEDVASGDEGAGTIIGCELDAVALSIPGAEFLGETAGIVKRAGELTVRVAWDDMSDSLLKLGKALTTQNALVGAFDLARGIRAVLRANWRVAHQFLASRGWINAEEGLGEIVAGHAPITSADLRRYPGLELGERAEGGMRQMLARRINEQVYAVDVVSGLPFGKPLPEGATGGSYYPAILPVVPLPSGRQRVDVPVVLAVEHADHVELLVGNALYRRVRGESVLECVRQSRREPPVALEYIAPPTCGSHKRAPGCGEVATCLDRGLTNRNERVAQALRHQVISPAQTTDGAVLASDWRLYGVEPSSGALRLLSREETVALATVPLQPLADLRGNLRLEAHFGWPGPMTYSALNDESHVVRIGPVCNGVNDERHLRALVFQGEPGVDKVLVIEPMPLLFYKAEFKFPPPGSPARQDIQSIDLKFTRLQEFDATDRIWIDRYIERRRLLTGDHVPQQFAYAVAELPTRDALLQMFRERGYTQEELDRLAQFEQSFSDLAWRERLLEILETRRPVTRIMTALPKPVPAIAPLPEYFIADSAAANRHLGRAAAEIVAGNFEATGIGAANIVDMTDVLEVMRREQAEPLVTRQYRNLQSPHANDYASVLLTGAGNCDQMAMVAAKLVNDAGGTAWTWGMPGAHAFTVIGTVPGTAAQAMRGPGWDSAYVVDAWIGWHGPARDYRQALEATMRRWASQGYRIYFSKNVAGTLVYGAWSPVDPDWLLRLMGSVKRLFRPRR